MRELIARRHIVLIFSIAKLMYIYKLLPMFYSKTYSECLLLHGELILQHIKCIPCAMSYRKHKTVTWNILSIPGVLNRDTFDSSVCPFLIRKHTGRELFKVYIDKPRVKAYFPAKTLNLFPDTLHNIYKAICANMRLRFVGYTLISPMLHKDFQYLADTPIYLLNLGVKLSV